MTILVSGNLVSAVSHNSQTNNSHKSPDMLLSRIKLFRSIFLSGNASSGKQLGIFGRIGIIRFYNVSIYIFRIFPFRFEIQNEKNVTVIMLGLDQEISKEPFDFKRDWVSLAVVLKI
jgi:hypothetical protein